MEDSSSQPKDTLEVAERERSPAEDIAEVPADVNAESVLAALRTVSIPHNEDRKNVKGAGPGGAHFFVDSFIYSSALITEALRLARHRKRSGSGRRAPSA